MSIFQDFSTPVWANLAKSLRDDQMAFISNGKSLAKATSLSGVTFHSICSPFGRLDRLVYEFTA